MIRNYDGRAGLNQLTEPELAIFLDIIAKGEYNPRVIDEGPALVQRLLAGDTVFNDRNIFLITYMLGAYLDADTSLKKPAVPDVVR